MTRGGCRELRGSLYARARFGKGQRVEVKIPWATSRDEVIARACIIAELAQSLVDAGRRDLVQGTAKELALTRSPAHVDKVRRAISAIVCNVVKVGAGRDITLQQWGERFTSGELSRLHPDHVRVKDWDDDESRLRLYVYPHVGAIPVHAFTLAHGDLVMAKCPLTKTASRRHVAQVMRRVLELAVYPGKLIPANPLPSRWMPRLDKSARKHYSCLWPREESKLLAHKDTPFVFRLFVGILNREGMRLSELLDSEAWQWNLDEGTFQTTKTKTGDPRFWALRPDVARAMRAWMGPGAKPQRPFAGVLEWCRDRTQIAGRLRAALKSAGVDRTELFVGTEHTGKLRAHDMRATFVTMALAAGKTETWIRDRTAHKSTTMIDRYRRAARQVEELKLGELEPLDAALGLKAPTPAKGGDQGGDRGARARAPKKGRKA